MLPPGMVSRRHSVAAGLFYLISLELCHAAVLETRISSLDSGNLPRNLIRERRGAVIDTVKGWFGFGQNGNNNPSFGGGSQTSQPGDSSQSGGAVDSGTQTDNGSPDANSGMSGSGTSGGNGVRSGPSAGNSGAGSQQSFTGNRWIDTAINAARGSGTNSDTSGDTGTASKGVGSRIVDALVKEGIKTLLGGVLGG